MALYDTGHISSATIANFHCVSVEQGAEGVCCGNLLIEKQTTTNVLRLVIHKFSNCLFGVLHPSHQPT